MAPKRRSANAPAIEPPRAYTVKTAARILSISTTKAYVAIRDGDLPSVVIAGCVRVPRKAVDELLPP